MAIDRAAVVLSGVCLVHCMAVPVAMLALPALGALLLQSETLVHWILLGIAVPISALALWVGYSRFGNLRSVWLGAAGLMVMFLGVSHLLGRGLEVALTLIGVVLVAGAHWLNIRRATGHGPV